MISFRFHDARMRSGLNVTLLSVLCACTVQSPEPSPDESRMREEALARTDVWHAAKLRGVAFRAIGQEPGWLLEITDGKDILLVTDYGQNRYEFPYVQPLVHQQQSRTEYVLDAADTIIEIKGIPCRDTMSGEAFDVTVTIRMRDRVLAGCGCALY